MKHHKFFLQVSRMPFKQEQRSIHTAFQDLDLLPKPWRLEDRSIIDQKTPGRLVTDYWTFRGRMGKGILGFFSLQPRVCEDDPVSIDVLCLEWNKANPLVEDLIRSFPQFIDAFEPQVLNLRRGMDWPECQWNQYSKDRYGWEGPHYSSRNNESIIGIVNYWNADLCQSSFGKTPQEVVEALKGVALDLRIIRDGVYVVFANNFGAEDDILELNRKVRPLLGGYGLLYPPPWYQPEITPDNLTQYKVVGG